MADRLTGIETFVLAMRRGSLSAAARDMGISAAMAAKHPVSLETRLGVTLVHRTTRRLSLTEAGADYLDKAERILADLREVESEIASGGAGKRISVHRAASRRAMRRGRRAVPEDRSCDLSERPPAVPDSNVFSRP